MDKIQETEVRNQVVDTADGEHVERQTVAANDSVTSAVLAQRVIYYIGSAILVLLGLRFVLLLLGASQASAFVNFIYSLSGFFVAPFNGIFTKPTYGTSTFDSATLVAMIVYAILMVGIAKLVTLNKHDQAAV